MRIVVDKRRRLGLAATALWVVVILSLASSAKPCQAEGVPVRKPRAANATEIREGASLFRANCSPCHGLNAQGGGRGPDLTSGRWVHGSTDAGIFRTITQGVPGTEMPAKQFSEFRDSSHHRLPPVTQSLIQARRGRKPHKGRADLLRQR